MLEAYWVGLVLGFSLILAIGAQNVFVLTQGLRQEHVFAVCLTCALSDAVLLIFGVTGFHTVSDRFTWLEPALRYGGAMFLIWYGSRNMLSALRSTGTLFILEGRKAEPLLRTLTLCLALTWLNPHVYLDTVVMMGMLSAGYPGREAGFAAGAISASFLFFFSLGYGARLLRPVLLRPGTWRICEALIAVVMWGIALKLLFGGR